MNFQGKAKPIDDIDLPRIGAQISVGEDVVHMLLDVEAAGKWFDTKDRPKMLFEPHIFWRELSGDQRQRAFDEGLAYAKWRRDYPRDSYPRLKQAMKINSTAALRSCSWGGLQVMGFNHKLAGYATVLHMVNAMKADAEKHLEAAVNFIVSAGLDDELQELERISKTRKVTPSDCVPFVAGYNGKGFRKNNYHVKAANALNKWRGINDTPFNPTEIYPDAPVSASQTPLPIDLGYEGQIEPERPIGLLAALIELIRNLFERKAK